LLAVLIVALSGSATAASAIEPRCRWLDSTIAYANQFEWFDREAPRGIRIIANTNDWSLARGFDVPLGVGCEHCRNSIGMGGRVFLHLQDPDATALDALFTPEALAASLSTRAATHLPVPDGLSVKLTGHPKLLSVFAADGRAAVFTISVRNWSVPDLPTNWSSPNWLAVGFREGCFSLLAFLAADDGKTDLALDDADLLASAFRLERYQPVLPHMPATISPLPAPQSSGGVWDLLQDRMTK
jgi:hypothetical protein